MKAKVPRSHKSHNSGRDKRMRDVRRVGGEGCDFPGAIGEL